MIVKKVVPRQGVSFYEFAKGALGYSGREIHARRDGVTIRLPYTVSMGYNAQYPNQVIASKKLHHGGKIVYIEEEIPKDKICAGADVYYQIIQRVVSDRKLKIEGIENELIKYLRVLPNEKWAKKFIRKVVDEMVELGYLAIEEEKVGKIFSIKRYTIGISVVTLNIMYDFVMGYEPVVYHISKYIENERGGVDVDELKYEFINTRRWIRDDKTFRNYLDYMEKLDCISIEGNRVKFKNPPPINS